ncbi:plasmid pRiA4b ORF-3 family protein [Sporolactobacillus shoreae]|uniref:Plasmid pRiA4b ORF-3 family protein n=1 Tax=Sporolactobacillus shoreae TaxID=1465501 RepID=A0A4Z0GPX1_9BACL|nr:plasmid pRiA4b ORF-3 family protein [Sporolactobacillus shoreae]TGA98318.1 plasmid pRiA4b ORF-3 family protein [Sporolactobacillus shoreae]
MLIQCTKKLLDQLKIKPEPVGTESSLFSWHANLITINRRKTIVLMNDSSRYTVVLHGLRANDFKHLNEHIINAIRRTLLDEWIKPELVERFLSGSPEIVYTKTKDRKLVARMNKACDTVWFRGEALNPDHLIQSAAGRRASALLVGDGSGSYAKPNELMYKELEAFAKEPIFSCRAVTFKATLDLENHKAWRRVIVPIEITFEQLHDVLQTVFDWKESHLHDFYILDGKRPVANVVCSDDAFDYPNEVPMFMETECKLSDYVPKYSRIKYTYDFGDNWEHEIEIEKLDEHYSKNYPVCLDGVGNAPPEDVGGPYGYDEFLSAISDPKHPEHEDMIQWGSMQGYRDFNIEGVNRQLKWVL